MIYYVISNDEGTVLAVYGEALLGTAYHRWAELSKLGYVHWHACQYSESSGRPHVGESISMRGHTVPVHNRKACPACGWTL